MTKKVLLLLLLMSMLMPVWGQESEGKEKSPQKIKTLVDYKPELGLSDEQVQGITTALKDFQARVVELRKQIKESEAGFKKLLGEQAPLAKLKEQLKTTSDLQFQLRYLDVVTARRVEGILSAEQLEKWRKIQADVRKK